MKKLLFTSITMLFAITLSAQTFTYGNLNYSINADSVSVTVTGHIYGQNAHGELIIPESVNYEGTDYAVTIIGDSAFYCCKWLTGSLNIPNSVISIGKKAFSNCFRLNEQLILGNSIVSIGEAAFYGCRFGGGLVIGDSVKTIGDYAFANCPHLYRDLIIGNSVTTIGASAFRNCNFQGDLVIGNSVITIGDNAFASNSFTGDLIIPASVNSIGKEAFMGSFMRKKDLVIGNSVTDIGECAFRSCSFNKVVSFAIVPPELVSTGLFTDACTTMTVPCGCVTAYQNSDWSQCFGSIIDDCDHIGDQETEWYYEIINNDGEITYQRLYHETDTTINQKKIKVIVKTNTLYDKDSELQTREYIYYEAGALYWWNKDLQEFTVLYDFDAEVGDEWEIKACNNSVIIHVDAVGYVEYDGQTFKTLTVSDSADYFSGMIVCGIGHLTSFFPERLLNRKSDFEVNGIRCCWYGPDLIYKEGDVDCDMIRKQMHFGVEEATVEKGFEIYPNPTSDVIFIVSRLELDYHIINIMGQTIISGKSASEIQKIGISSLASGLYIIKVRTEDGRECIERIVKE